MRFIIRCCYLLSLLLLSLPTSAIASKPLPDVITYPTIKHNFKDHAYYFSLLTLILDSSADRFGEYYLIETKSHMLQQRAITEIQKNNGLLDIVWTMTSIEREKQLAPIRFPLLRGLGGYRISLIHKDTRSKFENLTSEQAIKTLVAGQGASWPDALVLKDNNYELLTVAGHDRLFKMLAHHRFDYMPRGLHEVWNDAELYPNLMVEPNFALYYPSPYYFFVHPDNKRLISRLTYGFIQAEKNGSFKRLFESHPVTKNALTKANLAHRTVFQLDNNFMSEETKKIISLLPHELIN